MINRSISISILAGSLLAFLFYTLGFRNSNPIPKLDVSNIDISKLSSLAESLAKNPSEYGTVAEALLQLHDPSLSVFGKDPFPADKVLSVPFHGTESLRFAKSHIKTNSETLSDTAITSDSVSLGVSSILLGQIDVKYLKAAQKKIDYILKDVPRLENEAISSRQDVKEVCADFVFVTIPFLFSDPSSNILAVTLLRLS
jgi:hypothetical protein